MEFGYRGPSEYTHWSESSLEHHQANLQNDLGGTSRNVKGSKEPQSISEKMLKLNVLLTTIRRSYVKQAQSLSREVC